jgi:O-antigen ligase
MAGWRVGRPVGRSTLGAERVEVMRMRWQRLTRWWAVYYVLVLTIGRFEAYTQRIIWIGAPIAGLLTLRLFRRFSDIPSEAFLVGALVGWSLISGSIVAFNEAYVYYLRLLLESLFVVAFLGMAIRKSGDMNALWWAFLVVALFNAGYVIYSGLGLRVRDYSELDRAAGLTGNANSLGYFAFMGILGALAIFGETKAILTRLLCVASVMVSCVGLVLSASRGASLVSLLAVTLWSMTCLGGTNRTHRIVVVRVVIMCAIFYVAIVWIQRNTTLGSRISSTISGEDMSQTDRWDLAIIGARLTLENPLFGVGLGQFPVVSGTGEFAHNELVEFAATAGIPGLLLVLSIYVSVWRRLSRVIAQARSHSELYRAKMARVTLITVAVSGAVFRPNLLSVDTMFLLAMVAGAGCWSLVERRPDGRRLPPSSSFALRHRL